MYKLFISTHQNHIVAVFDAGQTMREDHAPNIIAVLIDGTEVLLS